MITDRSPDKRDTWEALSRRVHEALALAETLQSIGAQVGPVLGAVAQAMQGGARGGGGGQRV